jgi:hypothetical protein
VVLKSVLPPIPATPPHVSLNLVRIVDLPGMPIDDEVRGQQAYDLLSNPAVIRYVREQAGALKLPAAFAQDSIQTQVELPRFVSHCLDNSDETVRAAAQAIGRRLGRNLGHVLLTLRRGDAVNRAARPDWTAQDWERWGKIERVWLGGGLVSGRLGEQIMAHARAFLAQAGHKGRPQIALTSCPRATTLLGAARYLPATSRHALCLDFGHTSVKRACLIFEGGTITRLHRYARLPVDQTGLDTSRGPDPDAGRWVLDFVANAVAQTWGESLRDGLPPDPDIMLSVAAYVRGGRLLGLGLYVNLNELADDARPLLAEAVKARVGQPVWVHLIHDGTAACAVHAGEPHTAMVLLGTAMGIGFPPAEARGLRPLAPTLFQGA